MDIFKESIIRYKDAIGKVVFCNKINETTDIWVGIEFNKPVGKNDGTICGKRLFLCRPLHGIAMKFEKFLKFKKEQGEESKIYDIDFNLFSSEYCTSEDAKNNIFENTIQINQENIVLGNKIENKEGENVKDSDISERNSTLNQHKGKDVENREDELTSNNSSNHSTSSFLKDKDVENRESKTCSNKSPRVSTSSLLKDKDVEHREVKIIVNNSPKQPTSSFSKDRDVEHGEDKLTSNNLLGVSTSLPLEIIDNEHLEGKNAGNNVITQSTSFPPKNCEKTHKTKDVSRNSDFIMYKENEQLEEKLTFGDTLRMSTSGSHSDNKYYEKARERSNTSKYHRQTQEEPYKPIIDSENELRNKGFKLSNVSLFGTSAFKPIEDELGMNYDESENKPDTKAYSTKNNAGSNKTGFFQKFLKGKQEKDISLSYIDQNDMYKKDIELTKTQNTSQSYVKQSDIHRRDSVSSNKQASKSFYDQESRTFKHNPPFRTQINSKLRKEPIQTKSNPTIEKHAEQPVFYEESESCCVSKEANIKLDDRNTYDSVNYNEELNFPIEETIANTQQNFNDINRENYHKYISMDVNNKQQESINGINAYSRSSIETTKFGKSTDKIPNQHNSKDNFKNTVQTKLIDSVNFTNNPDREKLLQNLSDDFEENTSKNYFSDLKEEILFKHPSSHNSNFQLQPEKVNYEKKYKILKKDFLFLKQKYFLLKIENHKKIENERKNNNFRILKRNEIIKDLNEKNYKLRNEIKEKNELIKSNNENIKHELEMFNDIILKLKSNVGKLTENIFKKNIISLKNDLKIDNNDKDRIYLIKLLLNMNDNLGKENFSKYKLEFDTFMNKLNIT